MEIVGSVQLLNEDRSLLELIPPSQQPAATRAVTAPAYRVSPGAWRPRTLVADGPRPFGLLVLDGLLLRDVVVANTTCGELVGAGELLRPWDTFGERAPTPVEIEWKVLTPARVALLDHDFAKVLALWPSLVNAFVDRAIERSHSLALHVAIHCIRRVDISLLVLFAHLADRFGKVTPDGITLDIDLTHEDLGKLVGATRQSVSTALGALAKRGALLRREDRTWLLTAEPPEELESMLSRRAPMDPSA
jgi:CRP-like cAMP-binding protein